MKIRIAIVLVAVFSAQIVLAAPTTQPIDVDVSVDPRVEFMSVIFYLAGSPAYSQPRVKPYVDDAAKYFDGFIDSDVAKLARELRSKDGISYDAPMSLAVHLRNPEEMSGVVPLDPHPEGLDPRWKRDDLQKFLDAGRKFSNDSKFQQFFEQHRRLYDLTTARMNDALKRDAHLEWFDDFFGQRPNRKFHLILALLNGGQCYGAHVHMDSGDELYCILGVWNTDPNGEPIFPRQVMPYVVHEFCHSYANPLIDSHMPQLQSAGEKLFSQNEAVMRKQAYATPQIMLRESLVRACVVRYQRKFEGTGAANAEIAQQEKLGFVWTRDLSDLLGEYESNREQYKTLDDFLPKIAKFFEEYAEK